MRAAVWWVLIGPAVAFIAATADVFFAGAIALVVETVAQGWILAGLAWHPAGLQQATARTLLDHTHRAIDECQSGRGDRVEGPMSVMLVARFDGDVRQLAEAYDRAHAVIMGRGGAVPSGELRHHCATSENALFIIGVWESEDHVRARWSSDEFRGLLRSAGFPPTPTEMTILRLHAIEPPL